MVQLAHVASQARIDQALQDIRSSGSHAGEYVEKISYVRDLSWGGKGFRDIVASGSFKSGDDLIFDVAQGATEGNYAKGNVQRRRLLLIDAIGFEIASDQLRETIEQALAGFVVTIGPTKDSNFQQIQTTLSELVVSSGLITGQTYDTTASTVSGEQFFVPRNNMLYVVGQPIFIPIDEALRLQLSGGLEGQAADGASGESCKMRPLFRGRECILK